MAEWLGPAMFVGALVLLVVGYPVAFSLGGTAIVFGLMGVALDIFDPIFMSAFPQRLFGMMSNFTLLAIPYFVFMGVVLEKSGIAERLLETVGVVLGRLRGGLALAVVLMGALLAATTGVVAATVVAMGVISLPTMLRLGYDKRLATGIVAASGTLGQIIPPSVVLVVLGDQLGVSVGDLFVGSIVPGLLMVTVFAAYVGVVTAWQPELAPPLGMDGWVDGSGDGGLEQVEGDRLALLWRVMRVMLPPLVLIGVVLGSIFAGLATPTEAGAVGAVGALLLAALEGKASWKTLMAVADSTVRTTAMVMFILIGANAFSLVFRGVEGDRVVRQVLGDVPGGEVGFLVVSMAVVFVLGFFIDFFEIAFIVVPLFVPIAQQFGVDLVWYGVVLGANLQTSFLTPPFGFALFYLRGVAPPEVSTGDIYRGAIPFVCLQVAVTVTIIIFPGLVSFLPELLRG